MKPQVSSKAPDLEAVSAFAVYSGKVGITKNQQKRQRQRDRKLQKSLEVEEVKEAPKPKKPKTVKEPVIIKSHENGFKLSEVQTSKKTLKPKKDVAVKEPVIIEAHENGCKSPELQTSKQTRKSKKDGAVKEPVIIETHENGFKSLDIQPSKKTPKLKKDKVVKEAIAARSSESSVKTKKSKKKITSPPQPCLEDLLNQGELGNAVLEKLLYPMSIHEFFSNYWEQKPLLLKGGEKHFEELMTVDGIDKVLKENVVMMSKHLDITSYRDGVRETHSSDGGRAHSHIVWDYFSEGCSVRMLSPQMYFPRVHELLAALQEVFGCFVGSNSYLTPAGTQGFAPHYDDIEAFVLQIEGKKRWKVYKPRCPEEELPRFSSPNYTTDEIGHCILETTLEPGDVLYFPRGFIHYASSLPDTHSLHLTVSAYQKTTWGDLMEKAIVQAVRTAMTSDIEFRRGLPLGYLSKCGFGLSNTMQRISMQNQLCNLFTRLQDHLDVDSAADAMATQVMQDSLPPRLYSYEKERCVINGGNSLKSGKIVVKVPELDTRVRIIRSHCCRLVFHQGDEDDEAGARLFFNLDNYLEYQSQEPQFIAVPEEMVSSVQFLLSSYPEFHPVSSWPTLDDEDKISLASTLWDAGILMTETPLTPSVEDSDVVIQEEEVVVVEKEKSILDIL